MQETSATWKQLWAAGAAVEARATIGGTVYTDIGAPVINRAAMQEALSIGNVVSASLALAVRGAGSIPRSAAVVIEARLNDGATASEWLPQGTFYISRRARDPVTGVLALECYDALLKANAVWTPSAGDWPRTMAAVAAELVALLGVTLDSRTAIPSGPAFMVGEPAIGTSVRDALSLIAHAAGGNWIMTPGNQLRLVALDEAGDVLEVAGVVGGMDVGAAGSITGVRCTVDGVAAMIGDDTGIVVDAAIAPMIAADMAQRLIGLPYQPFNLAGAIYDPAAELGDSVLAGASGEIASVLYSEQVALGPAVRGIISAPEAGELTDEYPYIGSDDRTLALARAAVSQAVDRLDDTLTQQEIFNRLTDNGAAQGLVLYNGQLYVNATYMRGGTIDGDSVNAKLLNIVDGDGNVIASFQDVIQIGQDGDAHAVFDFNSFELYDKDGNVFFAVGDLRDSEGHATVQEAVQSTTSGSVITVKMRNLVSEVVSVYVGDLQVHPTITIDGNKITMDFRSAQWVAPTTFAITYKTTKGIYHYDFGIRKSGAGIGQMSVAEGIENEASGDYSHAEGNNTTSSGISGHAEGDGSISLLGRAAHAEGGGTIARGDYSHAEGLFTVATGKAQHVSGKYNVLDPSDLTIEDLYDPSVAWLSQYAEIVGNGASDSARSNARTLDWNGNEWIAGALSVGNAAQTRANLGAVSTNDVIDVAHGGTGVTELDTSGTINLSNGTVKWYKSLHTCTVVMSISGMTASGWQTVCTGLPAAADNMYFGIYGGSGPCSAYIRSNGTLMFNGQGTQTATNYAFTYVTQQ